MRDYRKVEVLKNDIWEQKEFYELREGDTFRMFESTGEPVIGNKNDTVFKATSNPFGNDGVWAIDVD